MRILILGAGRMGRWLSDSFCLDEETAVFDTDKTKLKYLFNVRRLVDGEEIRDFAPELLINAAGLAQTENAFRAVIPFLSKNCIISDIASVKNDLKQFYINSGFRFVSTPQNAVGHHHFRIMHRRENLLPPFLRKTRRQSLRNRF